MSVLEPGAAHNRARLAQLVDHDWRMMIGGERVAAARSTASFDPSRAVPLADVPFAGPAEVDRAVTAALRAFPAWSACPLSERMSLLGAFAARLVAEADDLAILDAGNSGNPVSAMRRDVMIAGAIIEHLAGIAPEVKGRTFPSGAESLHLTLREPFGVVGRILPSNRAVLFAAAKVVAPLVMGNTLVVKAADQTPLPALRVGEIASEVFPPGVFNVVSGDGNTTGDALVRHPLVKRIAVTGSVATGRLIQANAASASVKRVSLELGGKNPALIFPDADIARAADGVVEGMNFRANQGQSCGSTSRVFVHEQVSAEFCALLDERVAAIRVGDPLDPDTEMGCLVSSAQFDVVRSAISQAHADGARLRVGGGSAPEFGPGTGYFVEPTIFDHVDDTMALARQEVFGPVLAILTWSDEAELLRRANALDVGLTASIWTAHLDTAVRVSRALDVGYVWINGASRHFLGVPFGGHRGSGTDYEEGIEELESFTELKSINVMLAQHGGTGR